MTDNITLTQGDITLTIHTTKVEEDFSGNPIILMLPAPIAGSDAVTKFLNLNRVKRVLTITGYLKDEVATGVSASTERDNLREIASTNIKITTNYVTVSKTMGDDATSTWTMMKCKITEVATDDISATPTTTSTIYQVMIQLMEGTNLSE